VRRAHTPPPARSSEFEILSGSRQRNAINDPATFGIGDLIGGRFEIVRILGQGGMGQVFEAKDKTLGESVALKTISAKFSSDHNLLSRFRREVQMARKITPHQYC
jgi:eukaryotic-like serine/threonine-protein kinase